MRLARLAAGMAMGVAVWTQGHGRTEPFFCASHSAAETVACCKANIGKLPQPLSNGTCERYVSCSTNMSAGADKKIPICTLGFAERPWLWRKWWLTP